jgi:hypothetical protein
MKRMQTWFSATKVWPAILLTLCCLSFLEARAQTGVFAYGRANINEGGRVLVDDPQNSRLYIGGYRNDSTLVILVDYSGTLLAEVCFKADATGTTQEWLTDLKFDATGTELVGCGILQRPGNTNLGGYVFRMTPALVLGPVTLFPVNGVDNFAPYSVEDIGPLFPEYRLLGTSYPNENNAFYMVDKITLVPIPASMVDYDLTNAEGYNASAIGPNNTIYATGRFAHSVNPADYRAGIVQLNSPTGLLNLENTYLRPFGGGNNARLYSRDIILPNVTGASDVVTVGLGDFLGAAINPHHAFWASHALNTQQLLGYEIRFNEFSWEGAHEVARDAAIVIPKEGYLMYGQGLLSPLNPVPSDQLWLASIDPAGTLNWSRQYGGTGSEFFSGVGLESQQQMIPIQAGTARIAFTATTTSYGAGGPNAFEDILLVLTNSVGLFDADDDTCIVEPLTPAVVSYVANNVINMTFASPTPPDNQPTPPTFDPNLETEIVCGNGCFAAVDPDYQKILVPTTFDIFTNPIGTETWSGKYFIGADVTIDGIVLDVTETDVVFDPCVKIRFINGGRLRANNSTFRPCEELDSWEGIYFFNSSTGPASAVVNECIFKNAVEALRFEGLGGVANIYDARITNNLFVNCWRGISMPTGAPVTFSEGITGNTFTVDNRPILWGNKSAAGVCNTFFSTTYRGISAFTTTFNGQISQNDFINTSDLAPTDLIGIVWRRCQGRITLNNFTNNQYAILLSSCYSSTIENNRTELTQLYTPFNTQILVFSSSLIWVTGNHLVNSTEDGSFNPLGAAISMEYCNTVNVKENDVDGFTNGIQFYSTNLSAINENILTNCNVAGIVVDGGVQDTVSCNEIKMRLRPNTPCEGIYYAHYTAVPPTVSIKGNCITDATRGIVAANFSGTVVRVPRMHNNYIYNYTLEGVLSQGFDGAQGSGIGNSQAAARNTFVSNNLLGGAVDVETMGQLQTWYGNFGIATVSPGVTLIGNGIYHSIASCGHQIGAGNSLITDAEICDLFISNLDGSMQRLRGGDYTEFANPALGQYRGKLAAILIGKLIEEGDDASADAFKAWIVGSDMFSSFDKAWVEYQYQDFHGNSGLALQALTFLEGLEPGYADFVAVERIHHNLIHSGRFYGAITAAEIAQLTAIDEARGRYADDARDLLDATIHNHPHILKPVNVPDFVRSARTRDVSTETVKLFPNPAQTQVTVEYVLQNATGASLRIYDATGRIMLQNALVGDAASTSIDISAWAPGIYMVSVFNAQGRAQTVKLQVR